MYLGHEVRALMNGICALVGRDGRELASSLYCLSNM